MCIRDSSNGATLILGMGTNSTRAFSGANFSSLLGSWTSSTNAGLRSGSSIGADVTGTNVTISGAITNGANGLLGFSLFGNGTLTLTAPNTYTGTTTISTGALQVGNGSLNGSLGSGAVIDNGSLILNSPGGYYVTNAISGTGSVSVLNTSRGSRVTLTGINSFSGGLTVAGATVQILGDSGLGASTGTVTLNRGELYNSAGASPVISSNRSIILGSSSGYFQVYTGTTFLVNS